MEKVLSVILSWNEEESTARAIESLRNQERASNDILVVDNGSDVDPCERFRKQFPGITTIRQEKNRGVAGGRNVGLQYALNRDYDFVLFFDNDAVANPAMLRQLLAAARRNPKAGILGPKIYALDSERTIWRAGCTSWRWTYLHAASVIIEQLWQLPGLAMFRYFDTKRGVGLEDVGQFDDEEDISFQIGCTQLIRTALIREIGLLDERYFPYGSEDIDYCARTLAVDWTVRYVPMATCHHRVTARQKDPYQGSYYNEKNILHLARNNLPPAYFWLLFLPDYILLTVPTKIVYSIIRNTPNRRKALLDAIAWHAGDVLGRCSCARRVENEPREGLANQSENGLEKS